MKELMKVYAFAFCYAFLILLGFMCLRKLESIWFYARP
jgi:hypothetical protein